MPAENLFKYRVLRRAKWSCHETRSMLASLGLLTDEFHGELRRIEADIQQHMRDLRVRLDDQP